MRYTAAIFLTLITFTKAVSANELTIAEINSQIWQPFIQSYLEGDGDLHASLYSEEIVRVSGGEIRTGRAYIERMRHMVNSFRGRGGRVILFRFNERSHNDDTAYETGVFRLMRSDGTAAYGEFNVVLKKIDGRWKLTFDHDQPTDEAAWDAAQPMQAVLIPVH